MLLSTVVIALLLAWPIRIGPGDHEAYASCGNALDMDLGPWDRMPPDTERTYYRDIAFKSCTSRRLDRLAQSVGDCLGRDHSESARTATEPAGRVDVRPLRRAEWLGRPEW